MEIPAEVAERLSRRETEDLQNDIVLSEAIQKALEPYYDRIKNGESVTWEEVWGAVDSVANELGYEYGIPQPLITDFPDEEPHHALVLADGVPLRMQQLTHEFSLGNDDPDPDLVRNSWIARGDLRVSIINGSNGIKALKQPMAGSTMRLWIETVMARSRVRSLTADAELKAMMSLKEKINQSQWDSYVLSGCFPEHSKRSDLHYIFRKGLPTLVISYHGAHEGNVIAALCMHPMGYYHGTTCGVMTPTDEVIAHLLMMRGDEHKYWAKSGQWHVTDPRARV